MAFTASLFLSSNILDPTQLTLLDNSQGTDGTIASIQFIIQDINNNPVGSSPYSFPYTVGNTYNINPFNQDIAVSVTANWLNAGGTQLYTYNLLYASIVNIQLFQYQLLQKLTSTPSISNDTNWYNNYVQLYAEQISSQIAINIGSDQFGAQECIERAYVFLQNENIFF